MRYLAFTVILGYSYISRVFANSTSVPLIDSSRTNGTDFMSFQPGNPLGLINQVFQAMLLIYSPAYSTSQRCALQRDEIFKGSQVNQLWALQFLDSMGKPSSGIFQGNSRFMGNFDQCVSINAGDVTGGPITGMFAQFKFQLKMPSSSFPPLHLAIMNQEAGLPNILWHVCLPSACTQVDVEEIGRRLAGNVGAELKETYLYQPKTPTEDKCFIIAVAVFSLLGLCCITGTILDVFKNEVTSKDSQISKSSITHDPNPEAEMSKDDDDTDVMSSKPVVNGVKVILDRALGQRNFVGHRASLAELGGQRSIEQERRRSLEQFRLRQVSQEQDALRRESQGNNAYRQQSQGLTAFSQDSPDLNALRRESQLLSAVRRESQQSSAPRRESHTLDAVRRESLPQGASNLDSLNQRDSFGQGTRHDIHGQRRDAENSDNIAVNQNDGPRKIGLLSRFFLAFSLTSNLSEILKAKHASGDITCLHGIRVLSISWVILGHNYYMAPQFGNTLTFVDMTKWWTIQVIFNGTFSVDTFFLLSGCLVSFLFLREVNKSGGLKATQVIMYYTHRLLRLTPLYALAILFYTGITPYLETGPFARPNHDRDVVCRDVWWWNLLYISNFINDGTFCIQWSWYLPNDMQFYFLAPLVLIPIALGYQYLGLLVALLQLACHLASFTVLEEKYNASLFRSVPNPGNYLAKIYIKPWTRVGPYALGLILGFMLFKTRSQARLHKILVTFGWMISIGGALALVYVTYDYTKNGVTSLSWTDNSINAYEILRSPMWAICIGWVIFACASGYGGFINSFLSWQAWIPLSRLTFGTYLTHMMVIMYFNNNERTVAYFSFHGVIQRYLATFVVSYALSLVLSLLIETPVRNLTKPSAKTRTPEKPALNTTPGSLQRDIRKPDQRQPETPRPRVHPIHRQDDGLDDDGVDGGKAGDGNFELRTLNFPRPPTRGVYNRGFISDNPYDDIISPELHSTSVTRWHI
ncbi:unnamed protein product [Lymnaea stagnalis]|uniref:Nose resistant-to-fluoxetine protein N-terminal domain-containing protein n=1 Tax=Lymnaea stagnalis TaxID=6523 RepID=A0AAV2IKE4_LYMST